MESSEQELTSQETDVAKPAVPASPEPEWKPLSAKQRRVLGTLMEKSKTTPDAYPMTFTGLATGCNQKSNREPVTNYSAEQIETIVDELRALGAVTIVQGSGRVTKVRHYAYNWLAINKVEAAVMTELLLRGEQTIGELRTRASRMEPIADIAQMQQIFQELKHRNLVVELTPAGRGQLVSHNLYPEWEVDQLREKSAGKGGATSDEDDRTQPGTPRSVSGSLASQNSPPADWQGELAQLKSLVHQLASRLTHVENELGITPPPDQPPLASE